MPATESEPELSVARPVDRTPTSSFDAIALLAIQKAVDLGYLVLSKHLQKLGLEKAAADQQAVNLLNSVGDVAFDVVNLVTNLKALPPKK